MKNVALITGASSGIGAELARIHARKGGDLVLVARRLDKLNDLKDELTSHYKINVEVIACDLSLEGNVLKTYNEFKEKDIDLSILINNAGFGQVGEFQKLNWERQEQMIRLNILALTEMTRLVLPDMIAKGGGRILNTSSTASLFPGPMQAVYFATKAYVTSFSNAISEELKGTGVAVTNLMPGATETEFGATSGMDKTEMFKSVSSAKSVAEAGYSAMQNGKMDVIAGLSFSQRVMTPFVPFLPKKGLLKLIKKMQTTASN